MDIYEIRRNNARALARVVGGQTAFIEKTGKSQSQVSQWLGQNPAKNIGPQSARLIEQSFGRDRGWLDVPHIDLWVEHRICTLKEAAAVLATRGSESGPNITPDEAELLDFYRRLSPRRRKALLELLKGKESDF